MLTPLLHVTITPNRVTVRNQRSGLSASSEAPFSCNHLLADDIDILEHAAQQAMKQVLSRFLPSFPRVEVSTVGCPLHRIERRAIKDALANAGASQVLFEPSVVKLEEQSEARTAYVAAANRRR